VHLVGFIIRIYHAARSSECQTHLFACRGILLLLMVAIGVRHFLCCSASLSRNCEHLHLGTDYQFLTLLLQFPGAVYHGYRNSV